MNRQSVVRLFVVAIVMLGLASCSTRQGIDASGLAGNAAPGSVEDFSVNVGDRVFFTADSTTLSSTAQATLQRQAAWLQLYPNVAVTIEGHADERGTREYNLGLSARRAEVTRAYLASRGVVSGRMRTISYGKERPVSVCDAESCWSQNRRAVTAVKNAGTG